jgi:hypothetical protein
MRRLLVAVACLLAIFLLAGVAVVVSVHITHPRDESAYLAYLEAYGDAESDQPIADLAPAHSLVEEGDRACSWLGDQPVALWRTGRKYRFGWVMDRYMSQQGDRPVVWGSGSPGRSAVVAGAWSHLCPATWELHQPHQLHGNNGSD